MSEVIVALLRVASCEAELALLSSREPLNQAEKEAFAFNLDRQNVCPALGQTDQPVDLDECSKFAFTVSHINAA